MSLQPIAPADTNPIQEPVSTTVPRAFLPCPALGLRRHGLVLLLYVILTCLATYPLVTRPHGMLIGTPGDSLVWPWNFSWTRQALCVEHRIPFFSDHLYRPFSVSLLHHTHSFFYGLLYCVGALIYENPFFWSNMFMLSSFVLAAYGTFMLARLVSGATPGALLAGAIYAFCSLRMERMFGHLNILSTEYIPWFLYFLLRGARENRACHFIGAGLCLAASAWNDYYNALFLMFFTALFALLAWPLGLNYGWPLRRRLRSIAPGGLLAAALLAPFAWGLWHTVVSIDIQTRFVKDQFAVGILNYLLPPPGHRLLHPWLWPLYHDGMGNEAEATVFFGYSALFLAIYASVKIRKVKQTSGKESWFFLICMLVFLVLSFGTMMKVRWHGSTWEITLPYHLFNQIPLFKDFRSPARFGGMVCLCAAVLAACGLRAITVRLPPAKLKIITGGLLALVMLENLYAPHRMHYDPLDPKRVARDLVERIRRDPVPGAVLNVPFAHEDFPAIWMQTLHHKPAITGVLSRPTDDQMRYFNEMDVYGWFKPDPQYKLASLDPLAKFTCIGVWDEASRMPWAELPNPWTPENISRFCYFFDLRYLIAPPTTLATDVAGRLRTELFPVKMGIRQPDAWLGILEKQPEVFPIQIESGLVSSNYYFLANFAHPAGGCRWMLGREGTIVFRLDKPRDLSLKISAGYPEHIKPGVQRMTVGVGGRELLNAELARGWSMQECKIPAALLRAGYNYVTLGAAEALSPAATGIGQDQRPLSLMLAAILIEPAGS